MMATAISQMRGLLKLLSAFLIVMAGSGLVTWLIATNITAMIEIAPNGIALPIMAAIVPTNRASMSQPSSETLVGWGKHQIATPINTAIVAGRGLKSEWLGSVLAILQFLDSKKCLSNHLFRS